MLVEQILKTKGSDVVHVSADADLQTVVNLLDERRIGAVVAFGSKGEIVGVISERDVIRNLARHGVDALSLPVSGAMTRDVVTATPSDSVDACLQAMTDRRIRHLPVLRNGALVGLVSIGDLVKWKIAETEAEAEQLKAYVSS